MDAPNHYIKSFLSYIINSHNERELKQINNYLSLFLASSKLSYEENNGQMMYKCLGCFKSYFSVPAVVEHLQNVHSSELYETCVRGEEVIDLTQDEETE